MKDFFKSLGLFTMMGLFAGWQLFLRIWIPFSIGMFFVACLFGLIRSGIAKDELKKQERWNIETRFCINECVEEFWRSGKACTFLNGKDSNVNMLEAIEKYCAAKLDGVTCCGSPSYAYICEKWHEPDSVAGEVGP